MNDKTNFTLTVNQLLSILRALPEKTHFFTESTAQGHRVRYVGTRDKIIDVFADSEQWANAPAWNNAEGHTHVLFGMQITFRSDLPGPPSDNEDEFCVILDYNYEDVNERLPKLLEVPVVRCRARVKTIDRSQPSSDRLETSLRQWEEDELNVGRDAGCTWARNEADFPSLRNLEDLRNSLNEHSGDGFVDFFDDHEILGSAFHPAEIIGSAIMIGYDAPVDRRTADEFWESMDITHVSSIIWLKGFCLGAIEEYQRLDS